MLYFGFLLSWSEPTNFQIKQAVKPAIEAFHQSVANQVSTAA
jgi:hypothetical protein